MTYVTGQDLRQQAAERAEASGGRIAFARVLGVSPQYVSLMLSGKKPLNPTLLDLLGYERIELYQPKREIP